MSQNQELTPEQRKVLVKVEALLRLAGGTTSEEEAASAAAKAQELLTAYALDASAVGSGDDGRRSEEKLEGGFYEYERDLWDWVADVCYCLHFVQSSWVERSAAEQRNGRVSAYRDHWSRTHRRQMHHRVVGRRLAVLTATQTVTYLLEAVERLTREFIAEGLPSSEDGKVVGLGSQLRSRRAVSFREGCVATIIDKLIVKREAQLSEERVKQREDEARAAEAATAGVSSSTQMTVAQLRETERDANADFLYGEGWSAQQRAARAARAKASAEAEATLAAWALANPEEAAKQEKERRAQARKDEARRARRGGGYGKERDWGAYKAGTVRGAAVGLDVQTGGAGTKQIGGAL